MRKIIGLLSFGAMLATCSPAWAQSGAGVIVGVNFAKITFAGPDVVQPDTRTGLAVGLLARMPVAERIDLEADVLYSQKGAKLSEGGDSVTVELDYLDIPVLARMAATTGSTRVVVLAGPSFGFKVRARSKEEFGGRTESIDIGSDVSSFDFGFVIGGGVDAGSYSVDARYQWGLSNVNKDEFDSSDVKNRVFSVLFGITF